MSYRLYILLCGLLICVGIGYAKVMTTTHSYSRSWELFEYSLGGYAEHSDRHKFSLNFDENVSGSYIWYSFKINHIGDKIYFVIGNGGKFEIQEIAKSKLVDRFTKAYCPVIDYLYDDGLAFIEITSLARVDRYLMGESDYDMEYRYNSRYYSNTSHQLEKSGQESELLNANFDFWLGEGHPIGEWLEFVEPVVTKKETKTGAAEYVRLATQQNYDNELHIENGPIVKWSLLENDLLLYLSVGKREFYFEVSLGESPTVKRSVQLMEDNRAIDYRYDDEGRIETLIIRQPDQTEVYCYDTDGGFLTRKLTIPNDDSDTYVEEIFDVAKEYRKYTPRPDETIVVR